MELTEQEQWDQRYREEQLPWDTGKPSAELVKLIRSGEIPFGRALELGCGRGTNALYLAEQGFNVTATDISPTAIREAERRAAEKGLRADFRVADLTARPDIEEEYDFLFDRGVYHAVRHVEINAFLRLLDRVSREGTLYLCLCGNSREKHDPGPPVVSEEEIRAELGSLFDILDLHEFRFDQSLGKAGRPLGWAIFMRKRK